MKICIKCKLRKPHSEFNWKVKGIRLATYCKDCSRKYIREHYNKNKDYYLKKSKNRNAELRTKTLEYIGKYLSTHPCVDCGESDILVLEFDHADRKTKTEEVNKLVRSRGPFNKIVEEVQKCEVRCANCHRRKTAKETKSWRLKFMHP